MDADTVAPGPWLMPFAGKRANSRAGALPRPGWAFGLLIILASATTASASALSGGAAPDFIVQLIHWFIAGGHWHGSNGIPHRLFQHLGYVIVSILIGAGIALPVGVGLGHTGRGGLLAINITNIGRAVPTFGLIILVFLLLGFGFLPVLVALVALAVPPIVTNSYVGMRTVEPAVRQAATAMGMTGWQRLWRVELPIALPLVMAGVRTAVVQVISTATLAAYVGLGGLGRYLIDGLAQQNLTQVVGGAILVALLAVSAEFMLGLAQKYMVSAGLSG